MFGDPGLSALSFQLEAYRWEDHFRRVRERKHEAQASDELDFVIAQYNHVVGRYNALLQANGKMIAAGQALEQRVEQQDEAIRARDARIIELENAVKATDTAYGQSMADLHKRAIEAIDLHQEIGRLRERLRSQET